MQCIFDQKGPKRPKPDFSQNFHFFFKSKPKMQFKFAKLRRPMTRFRKISRNVDFWPKMAIFGPFLPPERGENWRPKFFLQESQTTRPYASNKPSYIKIRPSLGALSTKNGKKPYNVTTCNVFLTKKGPKRPKPDFSWIFHLFFSIVNPKYSLNMQN